MKEQVFVVFFLAQKLNPCRDLGKLPKKAQTFRYKNSEAIYTCLNTSGRNIVKVIICASLFVILQRVGLRSYT